VWDAAGTTLASAQTQFKLELGTGALRLSLEDDSFAPLARSARPQARMDVAYDGSDAQRWIFSVRREGQDRALRVISGRALPARLEWNGLDRAGRRAPDGDYLLDLAVLTRAGLTQTAEARVSVDTRRPTLSLQTDTRVFRPGAEGQGLSLTLGLAGDVEAAARWTLRFESLVGRPLKTFGGEGVPPATVVWNGLDERGDPVPGGALYYADFSVETDSGALATLPRLSVASRLEEPTLPFRVPLATVHFQPGDEMVSPEEQTVLHEAAAAVKKYNSDYVVLVLGHAETSEGPQSLRGGLELSFLRAGAVRDYLLGTEGLDPKRVKASGLGDAEASPAGGGAGRQRRVEVILYVQ
jgi:outer membrane protein OmpA-like peptidoglycan-associated protein